MVKRVLFAAMILAAVLVVAAPALAFNGYRADYDTTQVCAVCHTAGGQAASKPVFDTWSETKHAVSGAEGQATRLATDNCAGCHTANFDPSKLIPTPTATAADGTVTWAGSNGLATQPQDTGSAASSEADVGCSSCHYNKTAAHTGTAANPADLANAAICGQCHSRYAYTADTYAITPIPYAKVSTPLPGSPIPNPKPISLLQPQYAIGFETMGNAANGWTPAELSTKLIVGSPDWTPTPNPQATTAAGLQTFWQMDGKSTSWTLKGHDGSATQYTDWAGPADLHAQALDTLKAAMGPNPPAECLKCHSADYIIAPDSSKPAGDKTKYGITCVVCHTPHEKGTATGVWDPGFTPQLRTDSAKTLCVTCHTAELNGKVAKAGTTVYDSTKEIMDGTGAIGVPQGSPSVHRGKCVQCHMVPTTISRGSVQLGANHTFKIIDPATAAGVTPVPISTTTPAPSAATPTPTPVVSSITMPYSACSTCHSRTGDQAATWLQDTISDRQAAMHAWDDQLGTALTAAAKRLGYKSTAAANTALNKIKPSKWSKGQKAFQNAFTNDMLVEGEGSWGIHNWEYTRAIVLVAISQAGSVK